MKRKKVFYSEAAYVLGILILALGTALMERADFGVSMVVAPAYLLHLKLSQYLTWYSFGVSEYILQAVLLVALALCMGKFKKGYLFSFLTAVLYGAALDLFLGLVDPSHAYAVRFPYYIAGMLLCAVGVALFFHSYFPPEAYELLVKELSAKYGKDVGRVKTIYDCCSCLFGLALSFLFFGFGTFQGVKLGTIVCALVNGSLVGGFGRFLDGHFLFRDALKLRSFFEA